MPSKNIEIFDVAQGSPEWLEIRRGIPTASMFTAVLTGTKTGKESKVRDAYMRKLAGEILSGMPMETFSNEDMERGSEQEPEIRARYSFMHDADITPVGFIRSGTKGCSPDGLIGSDGMVEFKSAAPHVMIEILLGDTVPTKHLPQCHGNLWVAERKWIDLVIGSSPKMPLFVRRVRRDEDYIRQIAGAVADFNGELREMVEKIRRMS